MIPSETAIKLIIRRTNLTLDDLYGFFTLFFRKFDAPSISNLRNDLKTFLRQKNANVSALTIIYALINRDLLTFANSTLQISDRIIIDGETITRRFSPDTSDSITDHTAPNLSF